MPDDHPHPSGEHEHGHDHEHGGGRAARFGHLWGGHSHDVADRVDPALESSREGTRALWFSLLVLGATAAIQLAVVVVSGSVALLGDTLHNVGDALTAVPLGLAFVVGRRPANDRYTYGYGRAEDIAGLAVVAVVLTSAALAAWESIDRLRHPATVHALGWVAAAAVVGFLGNELAARTRIRTGERIGSAALVADGVHARTDGITSLAVLVGAGGAAAGWSWADPAIGLIISVAILAVARDAIRSVWARLMDAVDPALVAEGRRAAAAVARVDDVESFRIRWIGHRLHAEVEVVVGRDLSLVDAHAVAHDVEHRLLHAIPRLTGAIVHTSPAGPGVHTTIERHRAEQGEAHDHR